MLLVTYLSLREPPPGTAKTSAAEGRPADLSCERRTLDYETYMTLYRAVGGPWGWDQRLNMEKAALDDFLAGPAADIYVLEDEAQSGNPIGMAEFDCSGAPDIQLVNFGLVPEAFGRRWGSWFLREALSLVWQARQPGRIWLHTDTNDHPRALATYMKAGFVRDIERWQDARDL